MVIDIRHFIHSDPIRSEVCIVGGGVAGIVLALELGRKGVPVCLLESGGFGEHRKTSDLCKGENAGVPYQFATGYRSRYFGGSSNCWGGHCRPYDEEDFEQREWVPLSGWPISKAELDPYYDEAHSLLRLGPRTYEPEFWECAVNRHDARLLNLLEDGVEEIISQFSPPVRMGKIHREELAKSPFVTVYLWANVMELVRGRGEDRVNEVVTKTLCGRAHRFRATTFILACGGIENARLLLLSRRDQPAGLGNQNGLVGRYYMDHPRITLGKFKRRRQYRHNNLFNFTHQFHNRALKAHGTCIAGHFRVDPEIQKKEGQLNAYSWFRSCFPLEESPRAGNFKRLRQALQSHSPFSRAVMRHVLDAALTPHEVAWRYLILRARPVALISHLRLEIITEQAPNPESRILLSDKLDALGLNRVKINWQVGDLEKYTYQRHFSIVSAALEKRGFELIEGAEPVLNRADWAHRTESTYHHMGATRMHPSPRLGVVDANCKVHDLSNLYIAGSSVFPTGGAHFTTMTIVALAFRLAKHIGDQMSVSAEVTKAEVAPTEVATAEAMPEKEILPAPLPMTEM